jgi:hypothetical protein
MRKIYLTLFLVATVFILRPASVLADATTLQKTISSNESYVRRFKAELAQILKQPPDAETKAKLDNLNKKIRSLEGEIARLKPFVQNTPDQAPAAVTPPPSATPPTQMPKLETQWVDTEPVKEPEYVEDVFYLGSDWTHMTMNQKEKYIELANSQLAKIGVLVTKHVFFYQMEMDKVLREKPELRSKKLDNLFMAQVYRNEPPNRERLKSFREEIMTGHA